MKKLKALVSALLVLATLGALLCACGITATTTTGSTTPPTTTPPTTTPDPNASYTVTISSTDRNCQIIGDATVTVKGGETATFRVMLGKNYILEPDVGEYDPGEGFYTIPNVSENMTITLTPIYSVSYKVTVSDGDSYYAFKKQLDRFVDFLRTGKPDHPFEDTIEMAKIIIAGIRSREEGGRKVFLSEIQAD